jgi:hypothetical protein
MPMYRDVWPYHGFDVPLYKRAQITVADLTLAFGGQRLGEFRDSDRLTMFADNLVPHVLRVDGFLSYDDALAARIDAGELLPPGSGEEVEIRACAVHAVELLVAALNDEGVPETPMSVDSKLWRKGGGDGYKALPRHRTRTTAY